uniref:Uncharacterized protein n=1 Tax=Tetranychus urticae TaxID=32264 RepID=T1KH25_TETUR
MLIPQQISIITVLFLSHCTFIVWSVSLTRSVSSESTSSNVNKTDKFVTLVDSKAENTDLSQPTEARTFSSSLIVTPKSPKNANSSIQDKYNKTEWPKIDKVEPRFFPCLLCFKYGKYSGSPLESYLPCFPSNSQSP